MTHRVRNIITDSGLDHVNVKLLLRHILKMSQAQLIINAEYKLSSSEYDELHKLIKQCIQGIPVIGRV
jgi:hypothetical protein